MPLVVPQPVLYGGLMTGAASAGVLGIMAPAMFLGIANGLVLAFLQMLIKTTHPGVGVGTGLAKFIGGSAVPQMVSGFAAAGMKGQGTVQIATAVGVGLDITFQALAIPVPIVGSASPSGGSGVGVGLII